MTWPRESFEPSESVRVGVLGAGNVGKVHLQSARAMPGVDLLAVADAVPENRDYAREAGVESVYESYESLLRIEPIDVVIVALPPFLHAEAVELAAQRGCHAFVEKPLARTVDECDRMLEYADSADVAIGVDHTIRYLPDVRKVRNAYRDGTIGAVPYATISRVNYGAFDQPPENGSLPGWHLDPDAAGGGVLLELGVHLLDVLEWTFGDLSVEAARMDSTIDIPVEDSATLTLRSDATDTQITMHCGSYQWEDDAEFNMRYRLEGVTGTLDNEAFTPDTFYRQAATAAVGNVVRRLRGGQPQFYAPTYYLQAYYEALRDFVDAIRSGDQPPVDGTTGKRTVDLATTAYEVATGGRDPDLSDAIATDATDDTDATASVDEPGEMSQ